VTGKHEFEGYGVMKFCHNVQCVGQFYPAIRKSSGFILNKGRLLLGAFGEMTLGNTAL